MGVSLAILAAWTVLIAPGLGLARLALGRRHSEIVTVGLGVALGVALAIARAAGWHALGIVDSSGLLWAIEGALAAVGVGWFLVGDRGSKSPRREVGRLGWVLAGVTALGMALRQVIVGAEPGPLPAYDAPAHCTLARALLLHPGEASWAPFMDAAPHYPWGTHALLAELSVLTGAPIHVVFTVLVTTGLGAASILVVAALARALWRADEPAVGAAFVYACATGPLGLLYGRWGGLPSEVGLLLVCGIACALALRRDGVWLLAPLTLGLLLAHHLSAGIGAVAIGVPFLATAGLGAREQWPATRTVLAAVLGGAVLALPMWRVVMSVDLAGDTAALAIPRHMDLFDLGASSIGAFVLAFAVVPLASGRLPAALPRLWLLGSIVGLVCGFTLCFSVAKLVTGLTGEPRAILVPTRWAAALTYPLAVLAGGGAWQLWRRIEPLALRLAVVASLVSMGLYATWKVSLQSLDPESWAHHEALAERVEPGDVVVSITNEARWAGYLTGVTASTVPAPPGSDPLTPRATALAELPARVLADAPLPEALAGEIDGRIWVIADLRVRQVPRSPTLTLIEQDGPFVILEWRPTP